MNCAICSHPNPEQARICSNCRAPLLLQARYRVTHLVSRSGSGAVYRAEQIHLGGAPCAIKELLPDPNATEEQQQAASVRLVQRVAILAQTSFPGLPSILDLFTEENRDYVVMEYVEGETLAERLARYRVPLDQVEVLDWAQALCDALTFLHTRQPAPILHEDIKPANIMLTPEGQVKLIGLRTKRLGVKGSGAEETAWEVSPPFSPAEQYGQGVDVRGDIYALGVTLYQLLTNCLPPPAPARAREPVIPPRQLNPALSVATQTIVLTAMAERPADRFQSAGELKGACAAVAAGMRSVERPTRTDHPLTPAATPEMANVARPPRSRRRWMWLGIALTGIVVLLGALAVGANLIERQQAEATATARAIQSATAVAYVRETATAQTHATETAQAEATATAVAQAQQTGTAQAHVQETATANAQGTATANAQGTATANAQGTATANAQGTATTNAQGTATARAQAAATSTAAVSTVSAALTATLRAQQTGTVQAQATQTAQIRATALAQASRTATALAGAASPTPFIETFESNNNRWPMGSAEDEYVSSVKSIVNGRYHLELTAKQHMIYLCWPGGRFAFKDFQLTVEGVQIGSQNSSHFGVLFRGVDDSNFYTFEIADGQYSVWAQVNGVWSAVVEWTWSTAVRWNEVNQLGIRAKGAHLQFFVNGQLVAERDDSRLSGGGIGLVAGLAHAGDKAVFEFDNLQVRDY
jgi:hypothetical protein